MTFDEQTLTQIRDLAALGHTPGQIAGLLRIPSSHLEFFLEQFRRPGTEIYRHYIQGEAEINSSINQALVSAAEAGDTESVELLDQRKQAHKVAEMLSDLFGI